MRLNLFRNSMTVILGAAALSFAAGCPGTVMEVSAAEAGTLETASMDSAKAAADVETTEESAAEDSTEIEANEKNGSAAEMARLGLDATVEVTEAEETETVEEADMELIMSDPDLFEQYYQQLMAQVEELQRQAEEEARKAEEARGDLASQTKSSSWNGAVLSRIRGIVTGPNGRETYYNLNMSKVVANLKKAGYEGEYWVRNDGVKMFGDYIMVAANYSRYHYGSIVETSLGTGIVCDTGAFAKTTRVTFDIATNWR